jgi:hypothetical protein
MIQDDALLQTVELLVSRKPAFERELRKKIISLLTSLNLTEAREITSAGASAYFQKIIENLEMPGLLKIGKKLDPHLPSRDAMPEAWLRAHVKKLITAETEPAKAIKKPRQPKGTSGSAPISRRTKPEKVRVVVNG